MNLSLLKEQQPKRIADSSLIEELLKLYKEEWDAACIYNAYSTFLPSKYQSLKDSLREIAIDERNDHAANLKDYLKKYKVVPKIPDMISLQSLKRALLEKGELLESILLTSIKLEKDSINHYNSLLDNYNLDKELSSLINSIINDEESHLNKYQEYLNKYIK